MPTFSVNSSNIENWVYQFVGAASNPLICQIEGKSVPEFWQCRQNANKLISDLYSSILLMKLRKGGLL